MLFYNSYKDLNSTAVCSSTMEWNVWEGRKVFLRLKTGKVYAGVIKDVDNSTPPLIFITILDKFDNLVRFVHSEVLEIKEER